MYIDLFEKSDWDGNFTPTLLFVLELSHTYGRPITRFIRIELVTLPNQALREVDDSIK